MPITPTAPTTTPTAAPRAPTPVPTVRVLPGDPYPGSQHLDAALNVAQAFLSGYRGHTRAAYRRDLRAWWQWCGDEDVDPARARRGDLDRYADGLLAAGAAPATVARRLSTLAGFYRRAVEEELITRTPAAHVRRPRVSDESPTLGLDRAELARFLEAAEAAGPRDHALACLLALNGLRVSQVVGADVEHLTVERGHRVLAVRRKGGGLHRQALAPRTTAALDAALAGRTDGPLLLDRTGERLDRHDAARIVARLARRAGITGPITPHSLRHTFVTLAREAGVPLEDVQDGAGHRDPRTTRRYDRARHNLDRAATYRLAAFMAGAPA